MARIHRAHPPKFRQQTVELERSGRTPDTSARGYELLERIKTIWQSTREAYGRAPIHTEPLPVGERVSPNQADKRSRAQTHGPCTGQEHAQAKRSYKLRHQPPPGIP